MKPDVPIVLVGNKCDLPDKDRLVTVSDGQKKAQEWEVPFLETSAKTKVNVDDCFFNVVRQIRKKKGFTNDNNSNKPKQKKTGFKCLIL